MTMSSCPAGNYQIMETNFRKDKISIRPFGGEWVEVPVVEFNELLGKFLEDKKNAQD